MQISLKKGELQPILQFVQGLKIAGAKKNRARFRFSKLLQEKLTELDEDRTELAKSYANLDDQGQPNIINNSYDIPNEKIKAFGAAQTELYSEQAPITIDDYQDQVITFYKTLNGYNEDLSGQDAMMFGTLLDAIENSKLNLNGGK